MHPSTRDCAQCGALVSGSTLHLRFVLKFLMIASDWDCRAIDAGTGHMEGK